MPLTQDEARHRRLIRINSRLRDERDEAREKVAAIEALRDRWARMALEAIDAGTREWLTAASASLHSALNRGEPR